MLYKICSRCNEYKSIEGFGKRKISIDGYFGVCKKCKNDDVIKWRESKVLNDVEKIKIKELKKKYYIDNRDKILLSSKKYRDDNKEQAREYKKNYYEKNKEKLIEYSTKYHLNRIKDDPLYKFSCNIRNLIKNSIKSKGYKKKTRTQDILGIKIVDFLEFIESKFEDWMTWENYGNFDGNIGKEFNHSWTIDHVIPLYTGIDEEDILRLNHYSNLQPLCSKVNMYVKNKRIDFYK